MILHGWNRRVSEQIQACNISTWSDRCLRSYWRFAQHVVSLPGSVVRAVAPAVLRFAAGAVPPAKRPPELAADYARSHDDEVWRTLLELVGLDPGDVASHQRAWDIAFLPVRLGGLGLFAAGRGSPAAYWAAWADALPAGTRGPCTAGAPCLQDALTAQGLSDRPAWRACVDRARPPLEPANAPGLGGSGGQRGDRAGNLVQLSHLTRPSENTRCARPTGRSPALGRLHAAPSCRWPEPHPPCRTRTKMCVFPQWSLAVPLRCC